MANAITIAVRAGGGVVDPDKNFRLRLAVEKARAVNMPNDNVQRAIKRGAGGAEGGSWEEVTYEGYAPGGVAVVVETVTDNRNRTSSLIRNLFEKGGGSLGGPGSVLFQFKKVGRISLAKSAAVDEQTLRLIDLGAEDFGEGDDSFEVFTSPENLRSLKEKAEAAGEKVLEAEVVLKASSPMKINDTALAQKVTGFIQNLEEQDDVQRVCGNFEV